MKPTVPNLNISESTTELLQQDNLQDAHHADHGQQPLDTLVMNEPGDHSLADDTVSDSDWTRLDSESTGRVSPAQHPSSLQPLQVDLDALSQALQLQPPDVHTTPDFQGQPDDTRHQRRLPQDIEDEQRHQPDGDATAPATTMADTATSVDEMRGESQVTSSSDELHPASQPNDGDHTISTAQANELASDQLDTSSSKRTVIDSSLSDSEHVTHNDQLITSSTTFTIPNRSIDVEHSNASEFTEVWDSNGDLVPISSLKYSATHKPLYSTFTMSKYPDDEHLSGSHFSNDASTSSSVHDSPAMPNHLDTNKTKRNLSSPAPLPTLQPGDLVLPEDAPPPPAHLGHRLYTNYIPTTPEEISCIKTYVSQVKEKLSAYDAKIAELEAALLDVTAKRAQLSEIGNAHEALVSPLRRLPPEILQMIFVWCLPSTRNAVMHASEAPVLLGRVCSEWRKISLGTPEVWSSLHIVPPNVNFSNPQSSAARFIHKRDLVKMWLDRSGACPLTISFVWFAGDSEDEVKLCGSLLAALLPMCKRWKVLDFQVPMKMFRPFRNLTVQDVPLLEGLSLMDNRTPLDTDFVDSWPESLNFVEGSSRLRTFQLTFFSGGIRLPSIPWPNLTSLYLESNIAFFFIDSREMITTLGLCEALQSCTLKFPLSHTAILPTYERLDIPIRLAELRVLCLDGDQHLHNTFHMSNVLDNIVAPKLRKLEILGRSGRPEVNPLPAPPPPPPPAPGTGNGTGPTTANANTTNANVLSSSSSSTSTTTPSSHPTPETPTGPPEPLLAIRRLLQRSRCPLEKLNIESMTIIPEEFIWCLRMVPSLRELVVHNWALRLSGSGSGMGGAGAGQANANVALAQAYAVPLQVPGLPGAVVPPDGTSVFVDGAGVDGVGADAGDTGSTADVDEGGSAGAGPSASVGGGEDDVPIFHEVDVEGDGHGTGQTSSPTTATLDYAELAENLILKALTIRRVDGGGKNKGKGKRRDKGKGVARTETEVAVEDEDIKVEERNADEPPNGVPSVVIVPPPGSTPYPSPSFSASPKFSITDYDANPSSSSAIFIDNTDLFLDMPDLDTANASPLCPNLQRFDFTLCEASQPLLCDFVSSRWDLPLPPTVTRIKSVKCNFTAYEDPKVKARMQKYRSEGLDAFVTYQVPICDEMNPSPWTGLEGSP